MTRSRVRRIAFSVVAALLFLGLIEGGLRVAGFTYVPGEALPQAERLHELDDARMYEPDEELIWRLRPASTIDIGDEA